MTEYADAEAVFGSASRGDGDLLSDRDILIVDSDTSLLGRRRAVLESEGWSVASYTYRKLAVLAGKGVLFLEHLRAESTILRDSNHRLRTILNASIPKQSYEKDIAENARLAHLITSYPDCRMGVLWAADVLFVATRNFGILSLAQTGRYIFSYPKVLEALAEESVLPVAGISPLLDLRVAKASYRADLGFCGNADTIVNRALAVLPQRWFPRTSIPVSPRRTIAEAGELPLGAYHRLRHLERAYLSLVALGHDTESSSRRLTTLKSWIENPRAYALHAGLHASQLILEIQGTAPLHRSSSGYTASESDDARWNCESDLQVSAIA